MSLRDWIFGKQSFVVPEKQEPIQVGDTCELDLNSPTWNYIKQHCLDEIADLRKRNDNVTLDEVKTAYLRGKIEALRQLAEELPKKQSRETASQMPALIAGR